jgi:hypothetical protein
MISTASTDARAARRERVRVRYGDGATRQAIADELGVSITTVFNNLTELERAGEIKKRARGEAIAEGVGRYWQTDDGQLERERRSEQLREEPPVDRVCECCGKRLTMSASRARREPGRFCSRDCHDEWRVRAPAPT